MSKETKPTSKVIQISVSMAGEQLARTALCEDGSVWEMFEGPWVCILEPHKEPVEEEPENKLSFEEKQHLAEIDLRKAAKEINLTTPKDKLDKLPEVGKRYKHQLLGEFEVVKKTGNQVGNDKVRIKYDNGQTQDIPLGIVVFEELPDQEPTKENKVEEILECVKESSSIRDYKKEVEVQEALKKLTNKLNKWENSSSMTLEDVIDDVYILVNTLEARQSRGINQKLKERYEIK